MEYIWKSYRDHHPRGDSPAYIRLHSKKSRCRWYPIFTSIGNNCKHLLHIPLFLYPISRVSACLLLRRSETNSSFEFITLVEKIPTSAVRVSSMYSKKSYPIHTRRFGPGKIVDWWTRRESAGQTRGSIPVDMLNRMESNKQNTMVEKTDIRLRIIYTVCHETCRCFCFFWH